jgi:hypothetical protein
VTAPSDVLRQTHDEGVFITDIDHQGGDMGFAQDVGLAADQQVLRLAIVARAFGDIDGFLQADRFDVLDDLLELIEQSEFALYAIDQDLEEKLTDLKTVLAPLLASV